MSYTMEDFKRDYIIEHLPEALDRLPPDRRRNFFQSLSFEVIRKFFQSLPVQERLELLQSLPLEERLAALPVEERFAGLSAEQIRQYLEQLTAERTAKPRKPRRRR